MPQSINLLIDLASVDQQLILLRHNKKEIEHQIDKTRAEVDQCKKELDTQQAHYDEADHSSREVRSKLEQHDILIAKLESQVPHIRNEKEFVASKKQLEEARKHRGIVEDELLEYEIKKEEYGEKLKTCREKWEIATKKYEEESSQLFKDKETTTEHLNRLQSEHKSLLGKVDPAIQKFYTRCLTNGVNTPVCAINQKTCGGCHMLLQPQFINELLSNPDTYRNCPHCSRIVFIVPEKAKKRASG